MNEDSKYRGELKINMGKKKSVDGISPKPKVKINMGIHHLKEETKSRLKINMGSGTKRKMFESPDPKFLEYERFYNPPEHKIAPKENTDQEREEMIENNIKSLKPLMAEFENMSEESIIYLTDDYTTKNQDYETKKKEIEKRKKIVMYGIFSRETVETEERPFDIIPKQKEVGMVYKKLFKNKGSFAQHYATGRDLSWLTEKEPTGKYKFYLSLNPQKGEQAKNFLIDLLGECKKEKISIMMKIECHNYDYPCVYTWDIDDMKIVLQRLYKKHKDENLFKDVSRVLQGEVNGIPQNHIGWVQEPVGGHKGNSHSNRMGELGKKLYEGINYVQACNEIGIEPERPWEIQEN